MRVGSEREKGWNVFWYKKVEGDGKRDTKEGNERFEKRFGNNFLVLKRERKFFLFFVRVVLCIKSIKNVSVTMFFVQEKNGKKQKWERKNEWKEFVLKWNKIFFLVSRFRYRMKEESLKAINLFITWSNGYFILPFLSANTKQKHAPCIGVHCGWKWEENVQFYSRLKNWKLLSFDSSHSISMNKLIISCIKLEFHKIQ